MKKEQNAAYTCFTISESLTKTPFIEFDRFIATKLAIHGTKPSILSIKC